MVDVSFLLPTNRDFQFAGKVLESIYALDTDLKYEVCLYCPREVIQNRPFPNEVVWCPEPEEGSGPIAGFNHMVKESKGRYVICLVDDHFVKPNVLQSLEFIESDTFKDRKYKITSLCVSYEGSNGKTIPKQNVPIIGDTWCGGVREEHNTVPFTTMRFPVIRRDTIEALGNRVFHPGFKYHAGDLWLGYWLGMHGEDGLECEGEIYQYINLRNSQYEQMDCRFYHVLKHRYLEGYHSYV